MILAKTGVRRGEMVRLDVDDVDMEKMRIKLKPTAKRSNRLVFFDEEARKLLSDWLIMRRSFARADCPALFITDSGGRINKNHVYNLVVKNAERVGQQIPTSEKLEDHFTPHCCRHWSPSNLPTLHEHPLSLSLIAASRAGKGAMTPCPAQSNSPGRHIIDNDTLSAHQDRRQLTKKPRE